MGVRRGLGPEPADTGALEGERRSVLVGVVKANKASRFPFGCIYAVSLLGVLGELAGGEKENLRPQGVITVVCPHKRSSSSALIVGWSLLV